MKKLSILCLLLSLFLVSCSKPEKIIINQNSSSKAPTDDEIGTAIKEISLAISKRIISCSSNDKRYAIWTKGSKRELIEIWHLKIDIPPRQISKPVDDANNVIYRGSFSLTKSTEAEGVFYKVYLADENKWGKWIDFSVLTFDVELIKNEPPEMKSFDSTFLVPRDGLCSAIQNNEPLKDFLKTQIELDKEREEEQKKVNANIERQQIEDENQRKIEKEENSEKERLEKIENEKKQAIQLAKNYIESSLKCGEYYFWVDKFNGRIYKFSDSEFSYFGSNSENQYQIVFKTSRFFVFQNGRERPQITNPGFPIYVNKENNQLSISKVAGRLTSPNCAEIPDF